MVITKKICLEFTQKEMRKTSKHVTTKNLMKHKGKGEKCYKTDKNAIKTYRKQLTKCQ